MSYDLGLYPTKDINEDTEAVSVEHFSEGGTQPLYGTDKAELNITYNYSFFYYHFLDKKDGLRWLYGKQAKDCIERLEKAVEILGTNRYVRHLKGWSFKREDNSDYEEYDYWCPTAGNAGYALNILLTWARNNPEAYFSGD